MTPPPISTSTSPITAALIRELASLWRPKPQCVAIFTLNLAPEGSALQYTAPMPPEALEWMGPYAKDVLDTLRETRADDFVWVVNGRTLDRLCQPHPIDAGRPLGLTGFMGIPVRELRRDPEWAPAIEGFGEWFLREDARQREALDLPRPLTDGNHG